MQQPFTSSRTTRQPAPHLPPALFHSTAAGVVNVIGLVKLASPPQKLQQFIELAVTVTMPLQPGVPDLKTAVTDMVEQEYSERIEFLRITSGCTALVGGVVAGFVGDKNKERLARVLLFPDSPFALKNKDKLEPTEMQEIGYMTTCLDHIRGCEACSIHRDLLDARTNGSRLIVLRRHIS